MLKEPRERDVLVGATYDLREGLHVRGRLDDEKHLVGAVARGVEVEAALLTAVGPLVLVSSETANVADVTNDMND